MSFHRTGDTRRSQIERLKESLNSRQVDPEISRYASSLAEELDEDHDHRQDELETLLVSYRQTFREFYEQDPVGNTKDYLERFDSLENALQPLEHPEE